VRRMFGRRAFTLRNLIRPRHVTRVTPYIRAAARSQSATDLGPVHVALTVVPHHSTLSITMSGKGKGGKVGGKSGGKASAAAGDAKGASRSSRAGLQVG
jgi:hypothetical protein